MIVATGKRVPLNTQAPLTLPGMLSTAGHRDQSSTATRTPSLQITAKWGARHAGSCHGSKTARFASSTPWPESVSALTAAVPSGVAGRFAAGLQIRRVCRGGRDDD